MPDSDETVRILPAPVRPRSPARGVAIGAAIGAAAVLIVLVAGWAFWPNCCAAKPQVPIALPAAVPLAATPDPAARTPEPVVGTTPEVIVETATVEQIRRHQSSGVAIFRLAENPQILVLDFATLVQQGSMLNRIAALTEKADLPRDRILSEAELLQAIAAGGDTPAGFYYGHDYSANALAHFFAVAERDHIRLTPEEALLRRVLGQLGWFNPGVSAGLISVPKTEADTVITQAVRDAIFTHELSHGEYFSNPAYAAYVSRFFLTMLTPVERDAFRLFLSRDGYDTENPEIVENETHAYLLYTPNPRFFAPAQVDMTAARRSELRSAFLNGMEAGWLRGVLSAIR